LACDDSIEYIIGACDGKGGTFGAIDLIQKDIDVIVGPACGHGKPQVSARNNKKET